MLFRACEDRKLSDGACRLHTRILSLSRKKGYCWANNACFARELGVSKACISRRVNELERHGYIRAEIYQMSGNKRYLFPLNPENTSTQICYDPIDETANTYAQTNSEATHEAVETSSNKSDEALRTDAEHNNIERTKEIEQNGNEQSSFIVLKDEKNETLSEKDSESTQFTPYGEAALDGLLRSGRKLSSMAVDEQVQVVIAFCRALGEPMNNLATYSERVSDHIRRGRGAERLMHAIWNLNHSEFGQDKNFESKLNYLLGRNTQRRIDNAIDDSKSFYFISDRLRNAALPFSPLLEKDFRDLRD